MVRRVWRRRRRWDRLDRARPESDALSAGRRCPANGTARPPRRHCSPAVRAICPGRIGRAPSTSSSGPRPVAAWRPTTITAIVNRQTGQLAAPGRRRRTMAVSAAPSPRPPSCSSTSRCVLSEEAAALIHFFSLSRAHREAALDWIGERPSSRPCGQPAVLARLRLPAADPARPATVPRASSPATRSGRRCSAGVSELRHRRPRPGCGRRQPGARCEAAPVVQVEAEPGQGRQMLGVG